jgi:peptide-methionine (S)-S-oxide reductase
MEVTRRTLFRSWQNLTLQTLASLAIAILVCPLGLAQSTTNPKNTNPQNKERKLEKATFGGGCFWCTEAVFQRVKGVEKVVSGYTGGKIKNPTYEQVCTGTSGHAEVIQVEFDPKVVAFAKLLEIHWKTHDPTTLNRQGYDEGTQYRSAIFFENDEQKKVAQEYKDKLNKEVFDGKITTEITPLDVFYPAEDYHQNYYNLNTTKGYCRAVIIPKLKKFEEVFSDIKK